MSRYRTIRPNGFQTRTLILEVPKEQLCECSNRSLRRKCRPVTTNEYMRAADLSTLMKLYPDDLYPTDLDKMEALDIHLSGWINLQRELFSDFVEQAPYGVGWWAPHPGTKRRILIKDPQLLQSGKRYGTVHPILHRRILAAALDD